MERKNLKDVLRDGSSALSNALNSSDSGIAHEKKKAENGYRNACIATKDAIHSLGMTVYEAEKEKSESPYLEKIKEIKERIENENLWQLYELSLDGKTRCDNCGAVITSDSVFCNKCGSSVSKIDFSQIGISAPVTGDSNINQMSCPSCGHPISEGMAFCEKCGARINQGNAASEDKTTAYQMTASSTQASMSVCPSCGSPLMDGAMFCEKCGTKLI